MWIEAREWNFTNNKNKEEEDNTEEMYKKLNLLENGIDDTHCILDTIFSSLW